MAKRVAWAAVRHALFLTLYWARPLVLLLLKMSAYLALGLSSMGFLGNQELAAWSWPLAGASFACAAGHWWYEALVIKLAPAGTIIGHRWR